MENNGSLNPRNQWRFTYETLAHIPTLRLYLLNPNINPSTRCLDIKCNLELSQSVLVVSWMDSVESREVSVRVPIPKVLIDPDSKVEVLGRDDHIEVKMKMVLPVGHPVVVNLRGDLDRFRPIELGSDLKNLSSQDVHLFCKFCSTRLTKQTLRRFIEMPSVNWREVADNWFGACCCSFGGISEKLALQYIKTYDCAEGTCLLDDASVIISKDDLEWVSFPKYIDGQADNSYKVEMEPNRNPADAANESCTDVWENAPAFCAMSSCKDPEMGGKTLCSELEASNCDKHTVLLTFKSTSSADCDSFGLHDIQNTAVDVSRLNNSSKSLEKPIPQSTDESSLTVHCHCCPYEADGKVKFEPEKIQKWLHDCSLGSGFVSRTSNLSSNVEWVEFCCRNCLSVLGAYPTYKTRNTPVDGGIRLFKCYISTSLPVGGPCDIFRQYTMERVFANLLLEGAKDELSYRIVLRDLRTKAPMLQIVLLNSESWCFTGYCLEGATMKPMPQADLLPVVKVLFLDCCSATEASSRIIKDWSSKTHTEDVYMMTHEIEEVTKCLKASTNRLPNSCSYFQGMSLSSMER